MNLPAALAEYDAAQTSAAAATAAALLHTGGEAPAAVRLHPLPDPDLCRAKHSGLRHYADLVDCLVHQPDSCAHAVFFGGGNFCQHPDRRDIVRRTAMTSGNAMRAETSDA